MGNVSSQVSLDCKVNSDSLSTLTGFEKSSIMFFFLGLKDLVSQLLNESNSSVFQ